MLCMCIVNAMSRLAAGLRGSLKTVGAAGNGRRGKLVILNLSLNSPGFLTARKVPLVRVFLQTESLHSSSKVVE